MGEEPVSEPVLIKNVKIVKFTNSESTEFKIVEGDLLIEGNIKCAGEHKSKSESESKDKTGYVIDGRNKLATPGMVNAHTHAAMTLFRSYAEDMPLMEWLEKKIWPLEKKLKPKHIYAGTKLACLEMLKSGCTLFNDMYFYPEEIAKAASDIGIRACVSSAFFDFFDMELLEKSIKNVEKDLKTLKKYPVIPAIGPHAPYTVSLEGLKRALELSEKYNALIHFHLAETQREVEEFRKSNGKSVVKALDEIGFLCDKLVAAHCIWLNDEEISLLAERGVNVAHCPVSNMKLSSGVFRYCSMLKAGVNVCLGTDGAASNNNLNMLEEMKFAALLQKLDTGKADSVKAEDVFKAATLNGYRAMGIKAGVLEEGYAADVVLFDLGKEYFCPGHNLVADLVYSANNGVDTVIVDGKIVVENGHLESEKEEKILEEAKKAALDLLG